MERLLAIQPEKEGQRADIVLAKRRLFNRYAKQYQSPTVFLEYLITLKTDFEPVLKKPRPKWQPSPKKLKRYIEWALYDTVGDLVRAIFAWKKPEMTELKNVLEKMFLTSALPPSDVMLKWLMFSAIFRAFRRQRQDAGFNPERPQWPFTPYMEFTEESAKLLKNFDETIIIDNVIPEEMRDRSVKVEDLYEILSTHYKELAIQEAKQRYVGLSQRLDSCFICQQLTNLECVKCKNISYCSTACQKKDWIQHKSICCQQDQN